MFSTVVRLGIILNILLKNVASKFFGVPSNQILKKPWLQDNCLDLVCCAFLRKPSLLCFLAQVVCTHEEYNSVLSTLSEANKISQFGQY